MAIVTISRGTFSGGNALAERLAERLGYPKLGREDAIIEATKDYGISVDKLTAAVKNPPSIWQQAVGPRIAYLKCSDGNYFGTCSGWEFDLPWLCGASAPNRNFTSFSS